MLNQRSLHLQSIHTPGGDFTVVHATELTDPTEFTTPGSLILTVGLAFADSPEDFHDYAARLTRAGVRAIGFGTGLVFDQVPPPLIDAAHTHDLGLFEVPRATAFLAIANAVMAELSRRTLAEQTELLRRQEKLNRQAGNGLDALLREASSYLGAEIALAEVAPGTPPSARTSTGKNGARVTTLSIPLVVGGGGAELPGRRFHLVARSASADKFPASSRALLRHLAGLVGLLVSSPPRDSPDESLALRVLLDQGASTETRQEAERTFPQEPLDMSVLHADTPELLDDALSSLLPGHVQLSEYSAVVVHAPGDTFPPLPLRIATSPRTPIRDISLPLAQQLLARAQALSEPGTIQVQPQPTWLADPSVQAALQPRRAATIGALEEYDPRLSTTLRAYLLCGAQVSPTATRLGLHRHTIRAHLEKIEQVCQVDLSDALVRAELTMLLQG
nr:MULTISPECIES: PucR family transcriptional regulator [unclassified Corynebacterium]